MYACMPWVYMEIPLKVLGIFSARVRATNKKFLRDIQCSVFAGSTLSLRLDNSCLKPEMMSWKIILLTTVAETGAMICNPEGESHSVLSLSPLFGSQLAYRHTPGPTTLTSHPCASWGWEGRLCHFLCFPLVTLSPILPHTHHKTKGMGWKQMTHKADVWWTQIVEPALDSSPSWSSNTAWFWAACVNIPGLGFLINFKTWRKYTQGF